MGWNDRNEGRLLQLLPSEPRIADTKRAHALTSQYLQPALVELDLFFLAIRAQIDPTLRAAIPFKNDKPYPLGQCLEICLAVAQQLNMIDPASLTDKERKGHRALTDFLAAGGTMRRIWGDLRGKYFQNAFLLGSLYLDVSNDTVVITKPKVEILAFNESGMRPITGYAHYARIAEQYWSVRAWPNHVLPTLAPFYPMLTLASDGMMSLHGAGAYLMSLNLSQAFQPGESFLGQAPIPRIVFDQALAHLRNSAFLTPENPEQGRKLALEHVRIYRSHDWHQQQNMRQLMVQAGHLANLSLYQSSQVKSQLTPTDSISAKN